MTEKTYTYYEIKAAHRLGGEIEVLFGSYSKSDCEYEIEAEAGQWHDEGYRTITIVPRQTTEAPDAQVYADDDDVDTTPPEPAQVHYFASHVFGWASAPTRDGAIEKLINGIRSDVKHIVKATQKRGEPGAYVWTCQVNAPADAKYSINYYKPEGVEIQDGQEHAITYLTDKAMAHCRTYDQEVKQLRHQLEELKS